MCPGSHQAASLPGEMRQLHLQATLPGSRAFAEDLENERRAIEDLRGPRFLEVALLDGRELRVDDHDFRCEASAGSRDLVNLPASDQRSGNRTREWSDEGFDDLKADCRRETH